MMLSKEQGISFSYDKYFLNLGGMMVVHIYTYLNNSSVHFKQMNSIICMQYFENYFQKKQLIKTKLHGYGMHK